MLDSPWQPWQPSDDEPWDLRRVVHLHRRAGFAATWTELQRDLAGDPQDAVTRLLEGRSRGTGVPARFEQTAEVIGRAAVGSNNSDRLKAWWIYRCLMSPDPLGERLTLMWHNHFATSNLKIANLGQMKRQNELFRQLGRRPFGELLTAVVKDPAMLVWLDADANRKEHPNENLAREIMELFTLGVGNYTEQDVKEAARALTGWTVEQDQFKFQDKYHDESDKTVLGQTGPWKGDDLLTILTQQQAVCERIARRLWENFSGEVQVADETISELAVGLGEHQIDINWAVERILRSRLFFANDQIGCRILGPVEYIVGMVRAMEQFDPPPSTIKLEEWATRLGQDLFYPPNVFGWPGGRSWMTSRALISRANFADQLVKGELHSHGTPIDPLRLPQENDKSPREMLAFYQDLLGIAGDLIEQKDALQMALKNATDPDSLRGILLEVLSSPGAQLG